MIFFCGKNEIEHLTEIILLLRIMLNHLYIDSSIKNSKRGKLENADSYLMCFYPRHVLKAILYILFMLTMYLQ